VCNEQVKEWLCKLISDEGGAYGYKKLTYALGRNYNLVINKKKVYRLCKELDILRPQRKLKKKHPRRLARNCLITASNQLWETDLKYGYIAGEDRFFYVMSIIDVFDRSIIDYHIGLSCEGDDAARILKNSLFKRQLYDKETKPVIRSDNGPQYISNAFEATCLEFGIEHERIPFKTPNKNAHIESFHCILEEECLSRYEFNTYAEAYEVVIDFMRHYNSRRIHSSLKYRTPDECYHLLQKQAVRLDQVRA
jgi:putative transposase